MKDRIYHISDVLKEEYIRFPLGLLSEPKYKFMSLEAKMIYSLLLNRLTLSQKNGWINEKGEVYLIYTREDAAETLNLSYKKTIAAFKELISSNLLLEQRQGRGYPNLLYILKMEVEDNSAKEFKDSFDGENEEKESTIPDEQQICQNSTSRHAKTEYQELTIQHIKKYQNGILRNVGLEYQDVPKQHTKKNNNIKPDIENLKIESKFDCELRTCEKNEELIKILNCCELHIFSDEMKEFFKNIVIRLYYAESFKVGKSILPQKELRNMLRKIRGDHLIELASRIKENKESVTRPVEFMCSMLINILTEGTGAIVLSLPDKYVSHEMLYNTEGAI